MEVTLEDELYRALQAVPELAGRRLTFTPLSGGITNRNFLVDVERTAERYVVRLAGNDTYLLGISREVEHAATVAAAGVGVGYHSPSGIPAAPNASTRTCSPLSRAMRIASRSVIGHFS